jgi:hypothetical protein
MNTVYVENKCSFLNPRTLKKNKNKNFNYLEYYKLVKNISKQILLIDCFFAKKYIFAAY